MTFKEGTTVGERLATWQAFQGVGKRDATRKYHRELVQIFLREWPALNARADSVSSDTVIEFVQRVAHYSGPRFNGLVSILRAIIPSGRSVRRRNVQPKQVTLPGQAEFSLMLQELDRAPKSQAGLVVRLLALTGLRINEARQLVWGDVREAGLFIRAEVAKNGRARFVPFIGDAANVLERLRAIAGDCEQVIPQAECRTSVASACERAGIPRLCHHDFRRLFATRCIESGVDLPTVARWMGHSDGGALLGRTYFHLADKHSQRMAAKVLIVA